MEVPNEILHLAVEQINIETQTAQTKSLMAVILGLVPYKDGDKWCILYGENLQVGICGFGDSPYLSMCAFEDAFYAKV